jgi:hypothetical protein
MSRLADRARGSIVAPTRTIGLAGTPGVELCGRKAGVVAYLGGDRKQRRAFLHAVSLTPGIVANVVQRVGENGAAYAVELVGDPALVAGAVDMFPVSHWHYILDTPIPRGGQGTGPEKQRPTRPKQRLTMDAEYPLSGWTAPVPTVRPAGRGE